MVEPPGVGINKKPKDQPPAKQIAHAPQLALRSEDTERDAVPIARNAERPLPDARRNVSGGPDGE